MTDYQSDNDDVVGYKKPPKNSRFKKGQSGNPKGRPKNKINTFNDQIIKELATTVTVIENGKKKKMPKSQAIIKNMTNGALRGDPKAISQLLKFWSNLDQDLENPTTELVISWQK